MNQPVAAARLTIDLTAVVDNRRSLVARYPGSDVAAVVKADAYGLGLEPVARALAATGCATFFVAHLSEGVRLRAAVADAAIYVLNGLQPGTAAAFATHDLRPVLGSAEEIAEWRDFAGASGWSGPAALQIDTGLSRLGLPLAAADPVARGALPRLSLVMSHLACAEEPDHPLNRRQIAAFRAVRELFPGVPASLAASSGHFLPDIGFDLTRPGYALYGGNPTPGRANPMRPVVTLEAPVIQLREVATGDSVGYAATWTARRPTRLAILHVGYGDGLPRAASGTDVRPGGEAVIAGRRCPIVGRVSMDLTAIDVTDVDPARLGRGMMAEILGAAISIDELATRANTIGYEVLTALGRRYERVYRSG